MNNDNHSLESEKYKIETENLLDMIINDNILHSKWLNLLSYLEFIGSRKIFKTQQPGIINESVLKHASDEARHAFYLKQMIGQITSSNRFDKYQLNSMLKPFSGYRYIQSLDALVKRKIRNSLKNVKDISYICYVYMSYVIEVRANWLYDIYSAVLKKNNSKVNISMIISDEVRHLAEMKNEILKMDNRSVENISYFLENENQLFNRLLKNISKEVLK
jgi:hypothetical protein